MAGGEPADHVVPEELRRGLVLVGRLGDVLVRRRQLVVGHADAVVDHLEDQTTLAAAAAQLDRGGRRRERQGVLDEFGEEVREVGDGAAVDAVLLTDVDLDPFVVLHLGERRPGDVVERDGPVPVTGLSGAGEDEQRLRVAAHAGGDVVDLVEGGELVRVLLVLFEPGEALQESVDEALVATTEVDEHVGDHTPGGGLFGGEFDRGAVHPVEGTHEVADLVAGLGVDLVDLGDRLDLATAHPLHDGRQLDERDLLGLLGEALDGRLDGPVQHPQQEADEDQQPEADEHGEDEFTVRLEHGVGRAGVEVADDVVADLGGGDVDPGLGDLELLDVDRRVALDGDGVDGVAQGPVLGQRHPVEERLQRLVEVVGAEVGEQAEALVGGPDGDTDAFHDGGVDEVRGQRGDADEGGQLPAEVGAETLDQEVVVEELGGRGVGDGGVEVEVGEDVSGQRAERVERRDDLAGHGEVALAELALGTQADLEGSVADEIADADQLVVAGGHGGELIVAEGEAVGAEQLEHGVGLGAGGGQLDVGGVAIDDDEVLDADRVGEGGDRDEALDLGLLFTGEGAVGGGAGDVQGEVAGDDEHRQHQGGDEFESERNRSE